MQDNDHWEAPPPEAYSLCRDRLRAVVARDVANSKSPDYQHIDMVRIERPTYYERPSPLTWRTLDGLRPRHLELYCGWDEICDMAPLDQLQTSWPLESVVISTACGHTLASKYLYSISSLTLYYCCGISFAPFPKPSALRHLTIIQNNAVDIFVDMRTNTGIADNIQTLTIHSTDDCDFNQFESAEFFNTLKTCSTLLSLDLALLHKSLERPGMENLSGYFIQLPPHFPPNLEHLHIRGPSTYTIDDMSAWFQCAVDPIWLPNLKTISFRLDLPNLLELPTVTPPGIEAAEKFLATLAANRPALSIIR